MHGSGSRDESVRFRPAKCRRAYAALALICLLTFGGGAHAQTRPTQSGPVKGITVGDVDEFRGIPYATPPVGKLRWQPPEAPAKWSGTRDASAYGPACEQQVSADPTSEDCLTLNIFAPAKATAASNLPVMVWIHGGAFTSGSGRDFDGSALVQHGVVVVTVNYRLGYFGFLAHPALSAINPHHVSGNFGLLDQQATFAWVRRNIAGFGGDPKRITIFGESAGGQSVIDQLVSTGAGHLAAAIAQSGSYMTSLPTLATQETAGVATANELGCTDQLASCLRKLSATALNTLNPLSGLGGVSPLVDGRTIPIQPAEAIAEGRFQRIPVINGSNHDEYRLFVGLSRWATNSAAMTAKQYKTQVTAQFGDMAPDVLQAYPLKDFTQPDYAYAAILTDVAFSCNAHLLTAQMARYTKVYEYELDDPNAFTAAGPVISGFSYGSAHSSDLNYLFPSYNVAAFHPDGPPPLSAGQKELRQSMRLFWTNLAYRGDPSGAVVGDWPAFTNSAPNVMSLKPAKSSPGLDFPTDHRCALWKSTLLKQAGLPPKSPY
jgi:para-nitrobenzyl esterase